jgi:O-antigen/teichoic acid export membrane protein
VEPVAPPERPARGLLAPGIFVGVAVVVANALNAVFQIALARILDPGEYSLLVALVVITLIAAVPPLAFQAAVAREVAVALASERPGDAGAALRDTVRGLVPWAFAILVLGALAYPVLNALGRGDAGATLATAGTISAALVIPAVWGGLQGARLFVVLGLAHLTFAGTRLGAGLGVGLAGGGAAAVMGGVAGATALTLLLTMLPLRDLWSAAARSGARRLATLPNAAAATGLTLLTALASVDVLVAKLAFSPSTAGAYGVASVGARVLLLVPIGVTTVLFPRVAVLRDRSRERRHLLVGLGIVALVGAITTALLWSLAGPLVRGASSRPSPGFRSISCTRRRTSRSSTSAIWATRASIRSPAGCIRRCTAAGCGRCASSPASAGRRRRTSASITCSSMGRRGCRPRSICRR